MLFQGQELLEDRWFDDTVALDWEKTGTNRGILAPPPRPDRPPAGARRRDARACAARTSRSSAPTSEAKVLAMHRWMDGGPHDDTVVVANFADRTVDDLPIGFPAPGRWNVRFNSDASTYADRCSAATRRSTWTPTARRWTAASRAALVSLGPYSLVIFSRED